MYGPNLIAIAALISGALASPVAAPAPLGTIVKRGEGIHLVNCVNYSAVVVRGHTPPNSLRTSI